MKLADWPAVTVVEADPELGSILKSVPVPVREMLWGLPGALLAMDNVPKNTPILVGCNVTLMTHDALGGKTRLAMQVPPLASA